MTDILVTSPYQPFTLPTQFKAVFNGYIYCGTVDAVDPSVSQVQVYLVNESGDKVPVAQPLRTNAGGFLVYNGQPAKFVTSSNHSLLVRDSLGSQLWYAPNMAEIDPAAASFLAIEALRRSYAEAGYNVVGTFQAGFTIVNANDVGIDETTGKGYTGPAGVVAAGTNPTSGGFVDVSNKLLKTYLHTTSNMGAISGVLGAANDVIVDGDVSTQSAVTMKSGQTLTGAGGKVTVPSLATPAISINRPTQSEKPTKIDNIALFGNVLPAGDAAYAIFLRDFERAIVDGVTASGFTGGPIAINTNASVIRDTFVKDSVYHPALVAGGYGVLLDEVREHLTDGITFYAGQGNNGRHALYVSRSGANGNTYDGCMNTISRSIIAKYVDKNDRNFWTVNVRKSTRGILDGVVSEGSNGGIAYNPQFGDVQKHLTTNVNLSVLKYQNGVGVYGVSQLFDAVPNYRYNGWLDTGLILEVKPKDASVTGADCIGYNISGINGMLSNVVTNVSTLGNPILVQPGATNVIIDGVLDYMNDGAPDAPAALITFTGGTASCSNITVRGCKTSRPMFSRLSAVTDLTVDYPREAKFNIAAGTPTLTDPNGLIERIAVSSTSITVILNTHVTQRAADTVLVSNGTNFMGFISLVQTSSKQLVLRFYDIAGTQINPMTSPVSGRIVLHC